ncbi:spatacsin-like [Ptychodera flava]|uniref:spatacsin-like n=1 Tax=Ptychodera flava TaxID=63121 RepID=UPI00396A93C8
MVIFVNLVPVSSSTDSDKEVDGQTKGEDSPVTSSDTGTDIPPADLKPVNIPDDLFSIIFECEGKSQPWRALLACCVSLKRPILAVLAACYKEASVLHCLCVWLLTCMDEAHVALVTQDMTTVQWHRWSLDDLSIILDVAMENKYYSLVVKAFSVFDPNCALMGFLNFVEAFLAFHDADLCKLHLRKFQDALLQCRRSRNDIQLAQIGHQMWYEETAHKLTNILLQKCTTRYDMNMLLSAVTERNVTRLYTETDYVKLYTVFKLLEDEDIDLRMECFINPSEDANKQYYQNIIDTLQEKAKFNLAREFADIMDLPTNQITFNKLLCELSAIQESKVWQRPGGRETFWLKCHQTFKQHQTSPKVAANFFEIQAARQSSIVQQVYVREREQLLGLAHHWLSKEQPLIQREDLEKLEQQIWRCRIKVEVESSERSPDTDEAMQLDKMFQLPDSEKVEPDFGHLGNEELLIRETYIIKRNTPSLLTDPKESKALDKLIQRELENYCISQALKLAKQFQYYNQDLAIVMTCLQLAQGTLNVHEIDPLMKELPKKGRDRRTSWSWMSGGLSRSTSFASLSSFQSDTFTQDVEDVIETMETITEHCTLGKTCCLRILNCYTIGQVLNKSYESIVKHGRFDVLREVLTSEHAHRFPLAKTYIQSSGITDDELAGFLSDAITHSLSIFTGYEDDDAPDSGGELIFSPIQNRENFINLVKLCDNPAVLGNRLLDTAASFASSNTEESNQAFAVEIELLVRGHQCHTLCYNMEGIASVLRTCRTRSMVLAAAEEYSLLVRLLTGVGRYSEMTYIFDILMKVQQFELLFRKGIKDDKLKVALLDYLKRCCPEDKDTFTMVALKFSMHREIAELLEVEAKKFLQHIQHNYKNLDSSPDLQNSLQSVLQFYADAAESYVKVGCLRHAEKCVKKVRLLALQMHLLSTRTKVINLSQRDVNVFIAKHPRFPEALMVSEAYGKHTDWSTAIYNNVVVDGDFRYLEDFKAHLPLPSSLLSEVATRYKRDSSKSSATIANMKKLLSYFSDVELQYRLATEFGFNEIAMTLLQGEGGAFLKDVV